MFLVISDGGSRTREVSQFLDACGAEYMFHFSKFSDAGEFGKGDVIVGKLSYRSLMRTVRRNRINAIIDVVGAPEAYESLVAKSVAFELGIILIKLIPPVLPMDRAYAESINKNFSVVYSYKAIAAKINNTVGNAVFFTKPYTAAIIAESVFDLNDLYAPIASGAEFDVDLALEFGIPIMNVKDFDGFSGVDGIKNVLDSTEAKILVTDSACEAAEKLEAAAQSGAEVIFTQNTGYEYEHIFDDYGSLAEFMAEMRLIGTSEPPAEEQSQPENNTEEYEE